MRKFLRSCFCCALMTPLLGQAAAFEDDPWLMLEKAGQAAHKLSYKGIFVYQGGHTVGNIQIMHMNYPQGEFARVISLDGEPREVLRQGNEAVIYSPHNEKVMIEKRRVQSSFPALLPGLADTLKASYQARMIGQERVGGRDGWVVQLTPRDRLRYGYRFSVDREYGLLLKSVMFNERNEVVEQVAFSQLALIPSAGMDWFHPNVERGKSYLMQPEDSVVQSKNEAEGWKVTQLPPGFVIIDQVARLLPGKTQPVNQIVYSDGIASVSVFIEALDKSAVPKMGQLVQGVSNVYANVVDGYQVIVVGEVPDAVVKQIGDSVTFKK
jgi:sigma-E factor negative regulatory protein RseB